MKIVLDAKLGSVYDDAVASRYHLPTRYLRLVHDAIGDWAVFRRPRDGGEGIAYFGAGLIASVTPDRHHAGHHYASIEDYLPFPSPVPWKPDGEYAERTLREIKNVARVGVHLRGRSVRPLEEKDFVSIVERGLRDVADPDNRRRYWPQDEEMPEGFFERSVETRLRSRLLRNASFRKLVCDAYDDRCAVTRLRIVNGGGRAEVQAAHIRPVKDGGPDLVQNGLALSATAHWLFDRHLITIDPEHRLVVSHNKVPGELRSLLAPAEERIHLPSDPRMWPSDRFLAYHRECFGSGR
ncbi:HNH endonuclease [Rhizobiaceae bacterium]|nr:HNH endonuclease [Rhizobiaceae bacterium]